MVDRSQIQPQMEVIASDGTFVGRVAAVEGQAIRLTQKDSPDLRTHLLPLDWVSRVDRHVHLTIGREGLASLKGGRVISVEEPGSGTMPPLAGAAGAAIGAVGLGGVGHIDPPSTPPPPVPPSRPAPAGAPGEGEIAGVTGNKDAGTPLPPIRNPAVRGAKPRGNYYLPWVLGLVGTMLLLLLLAQSCESNDAEPQAGTLTPAPAAASDTADRREPAPLVTDLTTGTLAYDLNTHLASGATGQRTFTFDGLNFRTGSARLQREDREDLEDIARVLAAYPSARIAVVGFTDARGDGKSNARLGGDRANAVVGELAERGVAPNRMEARSGGEAAPVAPNQQAQGRAENRRTELILLSR